MELQVKRIMKWLETKFSRPGDPAVSNQPVNPARTEPDETANDGYIVETSCGAEMPGRNDSPVPVEGVLMPDIYGDGHDATVPDLKILNKSSPDVDISTGFDPYDTVVLHQKPGSKKR